MVDDEAKLLCIINIFNFIVECLLKLWIHGLNDFLIIYYALSIKNIHKKISIIVESYES